MARVHFEFVDSLQHTDIFIRTRFNNVWQRNFLYGNKKKNNQYCFPFKTKSTKNFLFSVEKMQNNTLC